MKKLQNVVKYLIKMFQFFLPQLNYQDVKITCMLKFSVAGYIWIKCIELALADENLVDLVAKLCSEFLLFNDMDVMKIGKMI